MNWIDLANQALFEVVVQPLLFWLGLSGFAEIGFEFCYWFLIGAIEVALLWALMTVIERRWPAEAVVDRAAIRTDVIYTLLHRLGGFALLAFALVQPLIDALEGALRDQGFSRLNLEHFLPDFSGRPLIVFLLYLVLFDFVDYWLHRGQHRWNWWWQLHAVHHSQRQMTFWSDNRNHLLDDLLRDGVFALLGALIGMPPAQFIALIVGSRVLQSVQHANWRSDFGFVGKLFVSPHFHRVHHAIGIGHEGRYQGCNFAVVFAFWDTCFHTANWSQSVEPTGIRDQLQGRDYGKGFFSQQWLALRRIFT